jgi:LysM repeat protein
VQTSKPASYTLHEGEFPYCIARRFNVNPDEMLALNGLPSDGHTYYAGLTLQIPQSGGTFPGTRALKSHPAQYVVQSGDTIYSIACLFGDVDPVNIPGGGNLATGTTIQIP